MQLVNSFSVRDLGAISNIVNTGLKQQSQRELNATRRSCMAIAISLSDTHKKNVSSKQINNFLFATIYIIILYFYIFECDQPIRLLLTFFCVMIVIVKNNSPRA